MDNYRENLEIDLKDLAKYILKYWKRIIIIAFIGLLLGGGLSFAKECIFQIDTEEEKPFNEYKLSDKQNEEIVAYKLSDKQIDEIYLALDTYKVFQNTREVMKESINKDLDSFSSTGAIDKDSAEGFQYKLSSFNTSSTAQLTGGGSTYGALTTDQKAVFDMLLGRTIDEEEVSYTDTIKGHIKTAILGAIACAFLTIIILALKYVL